MFFALYLKLTKNGLRHVLALILLNKQYSGNNCNKILFANLKSQMRNNALTYFQAWCVEWDFNVCVLNSYLINDDMEAAYSFGKPNE